MDCDHEERGDGGEVHHWIFNNFTSTPEESSRCGGGVGGLPARRGPPSLARWLLERERNASLRLERSARPWRLRRAGERGSWRVPRRRGEGAL
eukprot:scaffold44689_cov19-Tisochrysis_lutea.AAC.1